MRRRKSGWACAVWSAALCVAVSVPARAYEQEIRSEAEVIAAKVAQQGKKTVAVVDFTDLQGHVTELGRFLAEELSVALADSEKGFQVVDRTHLRAILQEHKLASSGLIDPETARALGKIAGVDALVTGTITPFADSVHMTLKVLDADTANIITSDIVNIPKTQGIQELLGQEIEDGGGGSGGPGNKSTSTRPPKALTADHGQFHFEVEGCEYNGGQLSCSVLITNAGADHELTLSAAGSRIIREDGTEYPVDKVSLGGSRVALGYWVGAQASSEMVQGVPERAHVTSYRVKAPLVRIALLELRFDRFTVQFRGIPVKR